MADQNSFLADLFKTPVVEDPSKVKAKTVNAKVDVSIESTRFEEGVKVKDTKEIKSEVVEVEKKFFAGNKTLYLSVDFGATVNLGSFNMGKVNVSLSMPVGTEITPELVKKIDGSYDFAKAYLEKKMEEEVRGLLKMKAQ